MNSEPKHELQCNLFQYLSKTLFYQVFLIFAQRVVSLPCDSTVSPFAAKSCLTSLAETALL